MSSGWQSHWQHVSSIINLPQLIRRAKKGSAAEEAQRYFAEALQDMERRAAAEIEGALVAADDHRRMLATAEWVSVRRLLKRFGQDISDAKVARKEIEDGTASGVR